MITRKNLVEALRVIHESDQVTKIVTRAKRIDVYYMSDGRDCLLVLPNPQTNDNITSRHTKTTNTNRTGTKSGATKTTTTTNDNRS